MESFGNTSNQNNLENTSSLDIKDIDYIEWSNKLKDKNISNLEACAMVRDRIAASSDLDPQSREFFLDTWEYIAKLIRQNKKLDINLLKIYLSDIKGYDLEKYSMINTLFLIMLTGLSFKE